MNSSIIRAEMHQSIFSSGIATGFLHDITGLQLNTGNSQEAHILVSHLLREYNKRCSYYGLTGEMVSPHYHFRPTLVAAGNAAVNFGAPPVSDSIIQIGGDNIEQIGGDDITNI